MDSNLAPRPHLILSTSKDQRFPHQPLRSSSPCPSDATAGPVSNSPQPGSAWSWVLLDQGQAWVLLLQAQPWGHVLGCPCSCLCQSPGRCLGLLLPSCSASGWGGRNVVLLPFQLSLGSSDHHGQHPCPQISPHPANIKGSAARYPQSFLQAK